MWKHKYALMFEGAQAQTLMQCSLSSPGECTDISIVMPTQHDGLLEFSLWVNFRSLANRNEKLVTPGDLYWLANGHSAQFLCQVTTKQRCLRYFLGNLSEAFVKRGYMVGSNRIWRRCIQGNTPWAAVEHHKCLSCRK